LAQQLPRSRISRRDLSRSSLNFDFHAHPSVAPFRRCLRNSSLRGRVPGAPHLPAFGRCGFLTGHQIYAPCSLRNPRTRDHLRPGLSREPQCCAQSPPCHPERSVTSGAKLCAVESLPRAMPRGTLRLAPSPGRHSFQSSTAFSCPRPLPDHLADPP
jgi:hypothetical protein